MKKAFIVVLFVLLTICAFAQTTSLTGDQVPDEAAARAVFSVHSLFSQQETDQQGNVTTRDLTDQVEKYHAKLKLSAADHAQYDAMMQAAFNSGDMPSLATVQAVLSADGQAKLLNFIRAEKVRMHYHKQPTRREPRQ